MEQIDYNLLFRWFVGLGVDDPVWDHSTLSKNRDRLLAADVAAKFLAAVLGHPKVKGFSVDKYFSVDGTLVEAWASIKSFRAKDGSDEPPSPGRNGERSFHNEKRSNETHASTTLPASSHYTLQLPIFPICQLRSQPEGWPRFTVCLATEGVLCQSALDPDPLLMYQAL